MVSTAEYYEQIPHIEIDGGCDYDFQLTFTRVRKTTLDGKVTSLERLGPYDWTGWSNFKGELRTGDGSVAKLVSLVIDGPADQGTLRLRGRDQQTWALQQAGYRSGSLTLVGRNPSGLYLKVTTMRWRLIPGSTAPTAVPVFDWTTLR